MLAKKTQALRRVALSRWRGYPAKMGAIYPHIQMKLRVADGPSATADRGERQ
jgi:hypothetical protein